MPRRVQVPQSTSEWVLELSPLLFRWLDAECNIHTAEELLSLIDAFPTALLSVLCWQAEELASARAQLAAILTGHVDDRLLAVAVDPPPQHGTGALQPPGWSHLHACPDDGSASGE